MFSSTFKKVKDIVKAPVVGEDWKSSLVSTTCLLEGTFRKQHCFPCNGHILMVCDVSTLIYLIENLANDPKNSIVLHIQFKLKFDTKTCPHPCIIL